VGFHPVAAVGRLCKILERASTKEETIQKTIQKQRIHKIKRNENTKQKTNKKNIQKHLPGAELLLLESFGLLNNLFFPISLDPGRRLSSFESSIDKCPV